MKNALIALFTLICLQSFGQTQPQSCTGTTLEIFTQGNNFLDDLIPGPKDSVIFVNVNIFVFSPLWGKGRWDATNYTDAVSVISDINYIFGNIALDDYGTPNVVHVPDSKIRFKLKNFEKIVNPEIYKDISTATVVTAYYDKNAINIYLGDSLPIFGGVRARAKPFPGRAIFMPTGERRNIKDNATTLAHELGHCLGLDHNLDWPKSGNSRITGTGYSSINLPGGRCPTVWAVDYEISTSFWESHGCGSKGFTNNLMSYNGMCARYLSPRQIAIMHYNLRTTLSNILTTRSYKYATTVNSAFNDTITGIELWNYDRYMKGNVIIQPGAKLTIGALVAMPKWGKITVKKKAGIVVADGILTNISGLVWKGVEIEGDETKPQVMAADFFSTEQGAATFLNSTVSNALCGARNYLTDDKGATIWNTRGGIIKGYYTKFINNIVDACFSSYIYYNSISAFDFCEFKTAGPINDTGEPDAHVTLWNISGTKFTACTFEYAAGTNFSALGHGDGIRSADASYVVDQYSGTPCIFKELTNGIRAGNSNNGCVVTIKNSRFIDNEKDAVYLHNMSNLVFENNYLRMPCTSSPMGNGLYLNECKYYTVKNNTFEGTCSGNGIGMYARLSKDGSHQVYRNKFSKLYLGINAVDNNSGLDNMVDGLKMNCNDFSEFANSYDIMVAGALTGTDSPTVMRKQGAVSGVITATTLVRNKYGAACSNQSKWYTAGNSTKIVEHGTNSDPVTQPTPQPGCSNATKVHVVASQIPLKYEADCPVYLSSGGGIYGSNWEKLTNINSYIKTQKDQGQQTDHFELQASVASKLEYFLTDTLPASKDSVIEILKANPGDMSDADLQLVFAYIRKGDYLQATRSASDLGNNRTDWKFLLLKLIDIYQEPEMLYSINTNPDYKSFLESYANANGKDGQGVAQAILEFVSGIPYTEPRSLQDQEETNQITYNNSLNDLGIADQVQVFPNPTQSGVHLIYTSKNETQALLELRDLLGKVIYSNLITNAQEGYVPLQDYSNGVYILCIIRDKEIVYKTKLVKQE